MSSEDCPEKQKVKRQGRLKEKLQVKADLERKKQEERDRKRQQALQFMAVLQESFMTGDEHQQRLLDSIDALFQVLDWEKQFFDKPQDQKKRIKDHFAYALPNYKEALRISMEQQRAAQAQQGAKT